MSLRLKMILSVSLGIILSTLAIIGYGYFSLRSSMADREGERLESLAGESLNKIDLLLLARQREMGLLSQMGTITSSFEYDIFDQANDLLASFVKNFAMYHGIYLTSANGKVVAGSGEDKGANRKGQYETIPQGTSKIGAPYKDNVSGKYLIDISTAVLLNGKQVATLTGQYDLADVHTALDAIKVTSNGQTESGHIMVAMKDGLVIYSPPFERDKGKSILQENILELGLQSVREALSGKLGYLTEKDEHGHLSVIGYAPGKGTASGMTAIVLHSQDEVMAGVYELIQGLGVLVISLILLGGAVAVYLGNISANPIQEVIKGLASAAESITHSASEMIDSSQNLSEGAAQQASSLEEVSASIHETSSTVSQNADNAGSAKGVVEATNKTMTEAHEAMSRLTDTMDNISKVSASTASIIKAIDEIAFQTNLLALNAAVEAARAGEAGAGFAIVADEVRNLAMRSTTAAKETSQMIEKTLSEIEIGSNLVNQTADLFKEVVTGSEKIGTLISEIATASHEQARGIDQINLAVADVEKIAQQNVAIAEGSSNSAYAMNNESERLNQFVRELELVVKGGSTNKHGSSRSGRETGAPQALLPR